MPVGVSRVAVDRGNAGDALIAAIDLAQFLQSASSVGRRRRHRERREAFVLADRSSSPSNQILDCPRAANLFSTVRSTASIALTAMAGGVATVGLLGSDVHQLAAAVIRPSSSTLFFSVFR